MQSVLNISYSLLKNLKTIPGTDRISLHAKPLFLTRAKKGAQNDIGGGGGGSIENRCVYVFSSPPRKMLRHYRYGQAALFLSLLPDRKRLSDLLHQKGRYHVKVSRSRFLRRLRSDLTRSLLKEAVRCDLKRLKN